MALPLFDSVRAGGAAPATQVQPEMIGLDTYLIRDPEHTVLLSVAGDSMIKAGLFDGDMLVVDTGKKAKIGDIVIAVVDMEFTVKYLEKDATGKMYLQPANEKYTAIYPDEELQIYGVVLGSLRKFF